MKFEIRTLDGVKLKPASLKATGVIDDQQTKTLKKFYQLTWEDRKAPQAWKDHLYRAAHVIRHRTKTVTVDFWLKYDMGKLVEIGSHHWIPSHIMKGLVSTFPLYDDTNFNKGVLILYIADWKYHLALTAASDAKFEKTEIEA